MQYKKLFIIPVIVLTLFSYWVALHNKVEIWLKKKVSIRTLMISLLKFLLYIVTKIKKNYQIKIINKAKS